MPIKAIIFDLDGTLLNTYEDLANAVNYGLNKCGFPTHKAEDFKRFTGNGTDMMITRALPVDKRDNETLSKVREHYFTYYNAHSGECTRPYDDINKLLDKLKGMGIRLGIVSNKIDFMTQAIAEKYFNDRFDFVTGQRDGAPVKPNPATVFEAMRVLGVNSSECLFVGDSGVDAETGKNAGVFTVGVLWGFRDKDELLQCGASAVISKPFELLNYV